jgi:hypothetical protein
VVPRHGTIWSGVFQNLKVVEVEVVVEVEALK